MKRPLLRLLIYFNLLIMMSKKLCNIHIINSYYSSLIIILFCLSNQARMLHCMALFFKLYLGVMKKLCIFFSVNIILLKTWSQAYICGSLINYVSVLYNIFLQCILNLLSNPFIEMFLYYHLSFVNMALYICVSNFTIFIHLLPFNSLHPAVYVI